MLGVRPDFGPWLMFATLRCDWLAVPMLGFGPHIVVIGTFVAATAIGLVGSRLRR